MIGKRMRVKSVYLGLCEFSVQKGSALEDFLLYTVLFIDSPFRRSFGGDLTAD